MGWQAFRTHCGRCGVSRLRLSLFTIMKCLARLLTVFEQADCIRSMREQTETFETFAQASSSNESIRCLLRCCAAEERTKWHERRRIGRTLERQLKKPCKGAGILKPELGVRSIP